MVGGGQAAVPSHDTLISQGQGILGFMDLIHERWEPCWDTGVPQSLHPAGTEPLCCRAGTPGGCLGIWESRRLPGGLHPTAAEEDAAAPARERVALPPTATSIWDGDICGYAHVRAGCSAGRQDHAGRESSGVPPQPPPRSRAREAPRGAAGAGAAAARCPPPLRVTHF